MLTGSCTVHVVRMHVNEGLALVKHDKACRTSAQSWKDLQGIGTFVTQSLVSHQQTCQRLLAKRKDNCPAPNMYNVAGDNI